MFKSVSQNKIVEIDHPATQDFKKKKLENAKLNIPDHLHFIPMNFNNGFSHLDLVDKG